jgi:anti-sigma factor RsiW
MSHQPFETWILDHESLPLTDRRTLQAHLDTCQQCQRLHRKWNGVRQELHARRMAAPAPGFSQRWKASLTERRAQAQRKQAWRVFGILLGAALLIFLLLAIYMMASTSPTDWLIALVQTLATSSGLINLAIYAVQTWLSSTPLAVNVVLWIYLTITFCLLSLVWVLVLWRTNIVGVFTK